MFHSEREAYRTRVVKQASVGQLIAIVSFFVNLAVGFIEVGVGLYVGSLALSADGVHSFVDAVVSLTVWFGIGYSKKKADGMFHYGYYKFDAIFSLFAAMIMVGSGMAISYTAIEEYTHPAANRQGSIFAILVAFGSIITAGILAREKRSFANKSGLVSLKTDAYNSVKDASASVIALFGIILSYLGLHYFDSLAGLIIGGFVMVAGYFAIKESSLVLADAYNNPEMIDTIRKIAETVPGIRRIDDLRIRRNGPFLVVEMHVRVDGNVSLFEADKITQEVARKMRENILSLGRITIKPEPAQNTFRR